MLNKHKIVVLGAGHVGSHCAQALCWRGCADEIVLVDIDREKAAAQAMDVADSLSFPPADLVVRSGDYSDCADADLIFVAIGKARSPGQTRLDLLGDSVQMARTLVSQLSPYPLPGIVVSITNPADIVADYLRKALRLPRSRVFSTGTLLDTARLIRTLSEETGVSRRSITAFSLGEHGDSSMIPFSAIRVGGLPLDAYPQVDRARVLERTRMIGLLKTMGMENGSLRRIFLYRALFIVVRGVVWGNVIGLGLCLLQHWLHLVRLDPTGYILSEVPVSVSLGWWLPLNIGVIAVILLLLLLPASIVSTVKPDRSIRYNV